MVPPSSDWAPITVRYIGKALVLPPHPLCYCHQAESLNSNP